MSHINKAYLDGEVAENGIDVSISNEPMVIYKETGKSAPKWKTTLTIVVVLLVLVLVAVAVLAYLYVDKKKDSDDDKTVSGKVIGGTDPPGTVTGSNGPVTGSNGPVTGSKEPVTGSKEPVTGSTPPTAKSTPPPPILDYRLPTSLKPIHYDVTIRPFLNYTDQQDFHFTGSVRLLMECKSATDKVTLHINVLSVVNSSIEFYGMESLGSDPSYVDWEEDKARQFIIFNLDKNTQVGRKYVIAMNFTSPMRYDLSGLYLSSYINKQNEMKFLATTQFQETDARKAFPCMDEPALKATFNVTVVRSTDKFSLSNMPLLSTGQSWTEGGNLSYVADVYQQTPVMSTYLLAFVVCDFAYLETNSSNGVRFRTYSRSEATSNTNYALIVGEHIFNFFDGTFFEIPYPLAKLDMIAIPDYKKGAMENWGLVTYRQSALIYELGVSNEEDKRFVSTVVSHELVHQWFGNLVTAAWWDDIWINEGFASYLSYLGVDYIYPGYKMFDTFVIDVQSVMWTDSFVSSHPVYFNVSTPEDIKKIFDLIPYNKGGAIIRMMRHFLGDETFRKGLKRFLLSKQYGVATHNDLWASLTEQSKIDGSNLDVKSIMDTWILQMNYPVVMVTRDATNDGILKVTQKRFLIDANETDPMVFESPYGYRWTIPFTFTTSRNPNFNDQASRTGMQWINKEEEEKVFDVGATNMPIASDRRGWVLANVGVNGYYRVNYDVDNWEALAAQLRTDHTVIPAINRAQTINDAWNLVLSGDVDMRVPLLLTAYLNNETDYVPWKVTLAELVYVQNMLELTSLKGAFSTFMRLATQKTYALLGHRSQDSASSVEHIEKLTRSLIVFHACANGNADCIRNNTALFDAWLLNSTKNPITPSMRTTVYCMGIKHGGTQEWESLLKKYTTEFYIDEREKQMEGLSCSKERWILNMYLNMILQENSPIRKRDELRVFVHVGRNPIGNPLVWNFIRANYDKFVQRIGSYGIWKSITRDIPGAYNTQFQLDEFKAFFESKESSIGPASVNMAKKAMERIQININWMKKNLPIMKDWLSEANYV